MFEFKENKLSDHITQIMDPTGVSTFLIQGEKEALLVDTAVGIRGLKEKVQELNTLPLTVVLTHGHGDHAGAACEFEKVYLSSVDLPLLKQHDIGMRMDYARMAMGPDAGLTENDFLPNPEQPFLELKDGQIFDLGGIHVEIIHLPGHTRGCCMVLVKEERAILFGDACNSNTLVMDAASAPISEYLENLFNLKKRENEFETVYYSHGPAIGPKTCLDDNIELCQRILAGTDDAVPCEFMGRKAFRAARLKNEFQRADGRFGNIVYTDLTRK